MSVRLLLLLLLLSAVVCVTHQTSVDIQHPVPPSRFRDNKPSPRVEQQIVLRTPVSIPNELEDAKVDASILQFSAFIQYLVPMKIMIHHIKFLTLVSMIREV